MQEHVKCFYKGGELNMKTTDIKEINEKLITELKKTEDPNKALLWAKAFKNFNIAVVLSKNIK